MSPLARVDARVALLLEQRLHFGFAEVLRDRDRERDDAAADRRRRSAVRDLVRDRLRRVAPHGLAAAAAIELRRARVQQLQVVVELRHRPHGGARRAHRIGLIDRNRGRYPFDRIDLRLVHAVEELPRVRRERLDVASLAFGVERVEDERRLAGARNPGDHDQLVRGKLERQVLEVVLACAAYRDRLAGRRRAASRERGEASDTTGLSPDSGIGS